MPFKIKKQVTPANPIFEKGILDFEDPLMRHLVAKSSELLPAYTRRKLEFRIIARRLLKRLQKMKLLRITPKEV